MNKTAIITGVTGQDGSFLADLLLEKGYKVIGITNDCDLKKRQNIAHITDENFQLEIADIRDARGIAEIIKVNNPDEYYNLAAQSFVGTSWDYPLTTFNINTIGTLNALEAIKLISPECKFYQASTSEMFGNAVSPQNEDTRFAPRSPYGISKLAAHEFVRNYRESHDMFAVSGILFNHESERRGEQFVTRKITKWIGEYKRGETKGKLKLGNIDAKRDWGYAPDYVEAMWLMLQQDEPEDFVISTGRTYSVDEFLGEAFTVARLNVPIISPHVEIDRDLYRPAEVNLLQGDASKAKEKLGWEAKTSFKELVKLMVENDL